MLLKPWPQISRTTRIFWGSRVVYAVVLECLNQAGHLLACFHVIVKSVAKCLRLEALCQGTGPACYRTRLRMKGSSGKSSSSRFIVARASGACRA